MSYLPMSSTNKPEKPTFVSSWSCRSQGERCLLVKDQQPLFSLIGKRQVQHTHTMRSTLERIISLKKVGVRDLRSTLRLIGLY